MQRLGETEMEVTISNEIIVKEPSAVLIQWARENLVFENPEYINRTRRGLWTGNTDRYLTMYKVVSEDLVLPCGVGKHIRKYLQGCRIQTDLADNEPLEYGSQIPLYDYQIPAVMAMKQYGCGILQSPCGSGKTQMGIALAASIGRRTLWVTHTQDLLNQSYDRAAQYFGADGLGKITGGKVEVGRLMTFATVQTLSKIDLAAFKYTWDVIIVDECHRLSGTPASVTMFYRVMSNLAARYKYGLSATVYRSDGLIRTTFAILGDIAYKVPDEAVADKTMKVGVLKRETLIPLSRECQDTDGTMDYAKLLPYLTENNIRNAQIVSDLVSNAAHSNLILSDRLEHLRTIRSMLPPEQREQSVMIDGKMTSKRAKAERLMAIEQMRAGKKRYLFATYSLAKEGLDIPRLDRLYLTTPRKDYAVITQSIGRIARTCEGKQDAICYDYVDDIDFCENQFKRRKTSYRKAGCIFL